MDLSGKEMKGAYVFLEFWQGRHFLVPSIDFFFFQAEDGIRDRDVTGVQTCALPISLLPERTNYQCTCYTCSWQGIAAACPCSGGGFQRVVIGVTNRFLQAVTPCGQKDRKSVV